MCIWIESANWYAKDTYVPHMKNFVLPYVSKVLYMHKLSPALRPVCFKNFGVPYISYVPYIQKFRHGKKFWFVLCVLCHKNFGMSMCLILAKKWCSMRAISCKYQQKLSYHKYLTFYTCQKNSLATAKQTKSKELRVKEQPEIVSVESLSVMKWSIHKVLFTFISCEFKEQAKQISI